VLSPRPQLMPPRPLLPSRVLREPVPGLPGGRHHGPDPALHQGEGQQGHPGGLGTVGGHRGDTPGAAL